MRRVTLGKRGLGRGEKRTRIRHVMGVGLGQKGSSGVRVVVA